MKDSVQRNVPLLLNEKAFHKKNNKKCHKMAQNQQKTSIKLQEAWQKFLKNAPCEIKDKKTRRKCCRNH